MSRFPPVGAVAALSIAAILAGCGSEPEQAGPPPPDFQALPETARASAERAFQRFQESPEDAAVAGDLAMTLDAHGQDATAAAYYGHAAARQPRALQWAYLKARALEEAGRTIEATEAYRAAVGVQPGHQPSRLRLAALLAAAGEAGEAEELYRSVLQIEPNSAAAWTGLGRLALEAGKAEAAVDRLEHAAQAAPDYRPALEALADAYRAAGDDDGAATFRKLAESLEGEPLPVYPDPVADMVESAAVVDADQHIARGRRLERFGEFGPAIAELEQALELEPGSREARISLLSVHAVQGDFGRAEESYEAAAEGPPSADLLYNLGVLRSLQERYPEAIAAYQESIKLDPDRADAYSNLGFAHELTGAEQQARRSYRRAIEVFPLHRLANLHLGRALLTSGDARGSLPYLRRAAMAEDQRTPSILMLLAEAQAASGLDEEAARSRSRAQQLAAEMNLNPEEAQP